jgi:predicted nucleotidyltransferase
VETYLGRRRRELRSRRHDKAWQRLRPALELLYQQGATEIFLFGSITDPEKFTEHSDIDLAVRGLPEEKHLEIEGRLEDILEDLEYDIIFLEGENEVRHEIIERIKEKAILWKPSLST